ncbi:uncharacterized protein PG986_002493 [Apiospora aurea]|uniref:Uncharacterized protein n=1 Tax=Apiospora aurea TaxID=335848 RepID=A0ABR1QNZ6_9PEZI
MIPNRRGWDIRTGRAVDGVSRKRTRHNSRVVVAAEDVHAGGLDAGRGIEGAEGQGRRNGKTRQDRADDRRGDENEKHILVVVVLGY